MAFIVVDVVVITERMMFESLVVEMAAMKDVFHSLTSIVDSQSMVPRVVTVDGMVPSLQTSPQIS